MKKTAEALCYVLCLLGVLQIGGVLLGSYKIAAVGWMSAASPLPLVFNQVAGVEYWASEYEIEAEVASGEVFRKKISSRDYERMPGPHTVHMAYGLPLILSPIVPDPMWTTPLRYGFCVSRFYQKAIGIDDRVIRAKILMKPRTGLRREDAVFEVECP